MKTLSHLDKDNRPTMVDVSHKAVSARTALAEARVHLPPQVMAQLKETNAVTKKGAVFDTAIIAGVMAAKKTHELIPFCHPIALEDCKISFEFGPGDEVIIGCRTSATHKTGVEMEALTGASVAALTVYDMCKALSPQIVITGIRLLEKRGGKSDFQAAP